MQVYIGYWEVEFFIFGVDTHRYTLALDISRNVLVLSNTMVQVPCLYVALFLRYSCFPQFVPVKAVHNSNNRVSEASEPR